MQMNQRFVWVPESMISVLWFWNATKQRWFWFASTNRIIISGIYCSSDPSVKHHWCYWSPFLLHVFFCLRIVAFSTNCSNQKWICNVFANVQYFFFFSLAFIKPFTPCPTNYTTFLRKSHQHSNRSVTFYTAAHKSSFLFFYFRTLYIPSVY